MTRTVDFPVIGTQPIHCAGCEERIRNALQRLPGVHTVLASSHSQQVAVTFEPAQVSPEQIRAKLEQLGYQVTPQGSTG